MKLTVDRKLFRDRLALCSRAVNKSMTIPVLRLTLMQAEGSRLALTNSDLEFSINLSLDANVQTPGSLCVDTERLLRYADNSSGETVSIEVKGTTAHLSCGSSLARVPLVEASDFPVMPKAPVGEWHTVSSASLNGLLSKTAFCISDGEHRYALKAALITASDEGWRAVATDGNRMSVSLCRESNGLPFNCLFPRRLCAELIRCLPEDGSVLVSMDNNNIFIRLGEVEIIQRRMTGNFPDWARVIPRSLPVSVEINTESLLQALNCAAPFIEQTRAEGNTVGLLLSHDEVHVTAKSQGGEAEYLIPVKYDGDPFTIYFNAHFLRDPLKTCGETVRFSANDPLRSATLVSISDPDTTHIVFPQKP